MITGKTDHGVVWRNLHKIMGGTGAAFHTIACTRNKVKRYKVKDNMTGRWHTVTSKKWDAIKDSSYLVYDHYETRFVLVESFIKEEIPA